MLTIQSLFLLALPIASVAWTVTHEQIFMEFHKYCAAESKRGSLWRKKFFYLFTCEYCFSHYVTILFLILTGYKLLLPDWRGYIIAGFALVWIANLYMSLFALLRFDMKKVKLEANELEQK